MAEKKPKKAKMKIPKMVHLSRPTIDLILTVVTRSPHLNRGDKAKLLETLKALKD